MNQIDHSTNSDATGRRDLHVSPRHSPSRHPLSESVVAVGHRRAPRTDPAWHRWVSRHLTSECRQGPINEATGNRFPFRGPGSLFAGIQTGGKTLTLGRAALVLDDEQILHTERTGHFARSQAGQRLVALAVDDAEQLDFAVLHDDMDRIVTGGFHAREIRGPQRAMETRGGRMPMG